MLQQDIKRRINKLQGNIDENNQVSSIIGYNAAIFTYLPQHEYFMQKELLELLKQYKKTRRYTPPVIGYGFDLTKVLFEYLQSKNELETIIEFEEKLYERHKNPSKSLRFLIDHVLSDVLYEKHNFATYLSEQIRKKIEKNNKHKHTIFIYMIGGLYPIIRASSILRYLHSLLQHTYKEQLSLVLFYPGERSDTYGLKFMMTYRV